MVDAFFLERALRPIALTKKYELPLDHEESRPLDAYVTNNSFTNQASDQRERQPHNPRGSANVLVSALGRRARSKKNASTKKPALRERAEARTKDG